MNKTFNTTLYLMFLLAQLMAQRHPEGLNLVTDKVFPGFVLFNYQSQAYLIDECGDVRKRWEVNSPIYHVKLSPRGELYYISSQGIEMVDWQGQARAIQINDSELVVDREIILLESGHFLCIGRRSLTRTQRVNLGFPDSSEMSSYDVIVEITAKGEIVWEWHLIDHVFQQRDSSLPNYAEVSDQIGQIDVELMAGLGSTHERMVTGMDYNEERQQILVSMGGINEVVILDHSTSPEEARTNRGGQFDQGGRLLYRWGCPQNYGISATQQLFKPHAPSWLHYGDQGGYVMAFNNMKPKGRGGYYSSVDIWELPKVVDGRYQRGLNEPFIPTAPIWSYSDTAQGGEHFYSEWGSGAAMMANGHLFISEGRYGRLFEIDQEGEMTWQYTIPGIRNIFRAEKYPIDYAGLKDKVLNNYGRLEKAPEPVPCLLMTTIHQTRETRPQLYYADGQIHIQGKADHVFMMRAYNMLGQPLQQWSFEGTQNFRWQHKGLSTFILRGKGGTRYTYRILAW